MRSGLRILASKFLRGQAYKLQFVLAFKGKEASAYFGSSGVFANKTDSFRCGPSDGYKEVYPRHASDLETPLCSEQFSSDPESLRVDTWSPSIGP